MNELVRFSPGDLVRARGREWVVLPGTEQELLRVRPLSGAESDSQTIHAGIEIEPVVSATFPDPDASRLGSQDEALLMRDAFQLALRRGAGPFRSAGRVAFEPRSYQLVPLMMALKLDPVRLLIADDVGIGKTIEPGNYTTAGKSSGLPSCVRHISLTSGSPSFRPSSGFRRLLSPRAAPRGSNGICRPQTASSGHFRSRSSVSTT
jgi:hypothetical protein